MQVVKFTHNTHTKGSKEMNEKEIRELLENLTDEQKIEVLEFIRQLNS